ncbi:MAG TPA: ABC transporter permease [Puia sp.]|uniref:ABC transporter permease n=1 Tax=Puia sp. TaxID=2045100 RepID=UPI002B6CE083|nr:ABC transporter permease [Puia sp.]HVU93860.1 ABC transporter permease [Puia sp.]
MFRNYLKTAWRSLFKNRLSSFINIGGLSIGMAVAMLIACWIYNEWSFDRQFGNFARIAQVWEMYPGKHGAQPNLPEPVADELRAKFGSNFKQVFSSSKPLEHVFALGDKKLIKTGSFIQPAGLNVLALPMLRGSHSGLNDPHSILLSSTLAETLFSGADPVGKILSMDDTVALKVTGVYQDFPYNSSFRDISFLAPWDLYVANDPETNYQQHNWGDNNWYAYVQLADNTDFSTVSTKIKDVKRNNDPWIDSTGKNRNTMELFLHPMSRWHLYSDFSDGYNASGRIKYVRLFALIGTLVLLLACINFMNLSTARSEKRAREVGIRKVVGSLRSQLIGQFFSESLLVTFFALAIALGLLQLSLHFFNQLADTKMSIPWQTPVWWGACIGFCLFTGLIAGSYPALYLSSFQSIKVLRGVFRVGRLAALPRKILVVVQFTVSIAMIIGTIIVFRQVQYAKDRPIGYDKNGLVTIQQHTKNIQDHFEAFRTDLLHSGAVVEVAGSVAPVMAAWNQNGGLTWSEHPQAGPNDPDFCMKGVTQSFAKTVGLQFVNGRDFRTGPDGADAQTMILNEAALKATGWKDPLGKIIHWSNADFAVIGVVKNVVMESPYETPYPALYFMAPYTMPYVTMKIDPRTNAREAMRQVAPIYAKYNPAEPFEYKFVDEQYDAKFRDEVRVGKLAGFFTALAILISCLGLFGLASFVAEQRIREIGVRKILGASVFNLWKLLSRDFVLLTGLSILIAIPVAGGLLHQWLQGYAYRTTIPWSVFALAGAALAITLLTVSFQAVRAALANPVKSLRSE